MIRIIKATECNGFISAQTKSANSLTFHGEIPKNAKDVKIRIIGEVEANGITLTNPVLEDIDGVIVTYHKDCLDGAIATAYFVEGVPEKLLADIQNYVIDDFEITFTEYCPHCGN